MSTPCEKLGYEEGMRFTLVNDDVDGLSAGDTLWLHSDYGSSNPEFRDTEKVNYDTETYYIDLPISCFNDTEIKLNVVRKVKLGIRLLATSVPREDYLRDRISCRLS